VQPISGWCNLEERESTPKVPKAVQFRMPTKSHGAGRPAIESVFPQAALPGGEVSIRGEGFIHSPRPRVTFGGAEASLVVGSDTLVIARVPEGAADGALVVDNGDSASAAMPFKLAVMVADSLHPVTNPYVDASGNVYSTFSGSRGQKTPVSVYRIDPAREMTPFLSDLMNATAIAGMPGSDSIFVSSRFDGVVYEVDPSGVMSVYVEGMGVATGLAVDGVGNLYVGDRSGTIFKVSQDRQIYVFATMEPSIAAYHLSFGPDGWLYVTGPTTSSFDAVHRVAPTGEVEVYFRGLGRPQGTAFDVDGNLYVAASWSGRRGVIRITPEREPSVFLSGPNIVGMAFGPSGKLYLTTTGALFETSLGIEGFLRR
jgi:sugar lactone lactonase YvrE